MTRKEYMEQLKKYLKRLTSLDKGTQPFVVCDG